MAAVYVLHSSRCANHALAAAPGAFTSLQQPPALRCGSGHGRVVHPPTPLPRAWLAWDTRHAGPVCPRDILPTLMACGGIPNPILTGGASPLSQGECPCSPCVSELPSRQNAARPGGSGGSPGSGLCCCQCCCLSQHPARRCLR